MDSSNALRFRRDHVYGLPTLWGAAMFGLVGTALWFSIFSQAPVDRWIAFLMIILILMHLTEANNPFRSLVITILPFEPPFANELSRIAIEVQNSTDLASEELRFKFKGTDLWVTLPPLSAQSSKRFEIHLPKLAPGKHQLPNLSVKMRPSTHLFQLWKVLRPEADFFVLPQPLDHGLALLNSKRGDTDSELSHLESILDERLMYKMDHKLFLKTGKPYFRAMELTRPESSLSLRWKALEALSEVARGEQFSAWLQEVRQIQLKTRFLPHASGATNAFVEIETPFCQRIGALDQMDWHDVKEKYAEWLYAES